MSNITLQAALDFVNRKAFENMGRYLSDLEVLIFKGSWEDLTYQKIGQKHGYTPGYLNNDAGPALWDKLTNTLGERVSKKNFKESLERKMRAERLNISLPVIPYPAGSESLDSEFYVERDGLEDLCRQTILRPSALLRIKAPMRLGKTSLITKIIDYANNNDYKTVRLDFDGANRDTLSHLESLLRWICFTICRQLTIEDHIHKYWSSEILGINDNCTCYFEDYLLPTMDTPLVLVLDDVDRVFPYAEVIEDFFGMLRSWHEKGKTSKLWQHVRLVMAHSTEVYIPLDLNQSPFNAGIPIELKDFTDSEVSSLVHRHQLGWAQDKTQVAQLMNMVGGHPYLVRIALYHIATRNITLRDFLAAAQTEGGPYSTSLRHYLWILEDDADLKETYKKVLKDAQMDALDPRQRWRLHSLGLVSFQNNTVIPRCHLYRLYFSQVLGV